MKNTISFVLTVMFSMSLMAQTPQRSAEKFNKVLTLKQGRSVLHLENKREEHAFRDKKMINDYRAVSQKSAETIKQRLDSVIYKEPDNLGNWINSYKESYTYDSKGNETSESYYEWDIATGKLASSEKFEITWDSNGNYTTGIWYEWDELSGKWVGFEKYENTYDSNVNISAHNYYEKDETSGNWVRFGKGEATYDSNGNNTIWIYYNLDEITQNITDGYKSQTSFDSNGKEILSLKHYWDVTTNKWIENYKDEYVYDANGNLTDVLIWHKYSVDWLCDRKVELTYDTYRNNTSYIIYRWDNYQGKFVIDNKYENTFDLNGNLILQIDYERDEETGILAANSKTEVTWNNSFSDFIYPRYFYSVDFPEYSSPTVFKHMLTGYDEYSWNADASKWDLSGKATYYYSGQDITGIQENMANSVNIYPNPATDFLTFNFKDASQPALVELFDIQGKTLISRKIYDNQKLPVSHLQSGMYFCKVSQNGIQFNSKVLIN